MTDEEGEEEDREWRTCRRWRGVWRDASAQRDPILSDHA